MICGRACVDKKTKNLLYKIKPGEIAVIFHKDLDVIAAASLVEKKVKAVINFEPSHSGQYLNKGPEILINSKIPLIDIISTFQGSIKEGDFVIVKENGDVYVNGNYFARGQFVDLKYIKIKNNYARQNMDKYLIDFVENTINFIKKNEDLITSNYKVPETKTNLKGRHALIVIRGHEYKEDLLILRDYIEEMKPVLVGVDGGADALLEFGYKPDIIIGDMDSISDKGLLCGAEIIVHAYPDGRAPGIERVRKLGLNYGIFSVSGTSEDAAFLLAFEKGADLIVAVGTHTSLVDFLEKGRSGMASTFLVRLKVGHILIDAKGVNKLYKGRAGNFDLIFTLVLTGVIPLLIITINSPFLLHTVKLLFLKVKLALMMF
ncbi:MAG: putative cytokinetic ring protein SteA [Thermovenabulum sp.]|uniref:putative cytokinetic ring protein SteA n=1 Tax=Thermovenabulum sp. TaxID=3100335 RepID=UPI003C79ECEA